MFDFNLCQKASEATRDICTEYREDAIAKRTAQDWFTRFKHDNFDLNYSLRSGRPDGTPRALLGGPSTSSQFPRPHPDGFPSLPLPFK